MYSATASNKNAVPRKWAIQPVVRSNASQDAANPNRMTRNQMSMAERRRASSYREVSSTSLAAESFRAGSPILPGWSWQRIGAASLSAAAKSPEGWSWKTIETLGAANGRNLTGFSHGAAGIGWAFLQSFQAIGESRFQAAAEQLFGTSAPSTTRMPATGKISGRRPMCELVEAVNAAVTSFTPGG
jgi:hypothetical protein